MKSKAFTRMVVLVLVLGLMLVGCNNEPDNTGGGEIDFTSHNTDYSILVGNNTSERLVAFKADLLPQTLIGGIPARAQNHGLPKNPALFDKTEDFPLILLTEEQYNNNKNNLGSLKDTPFTRVYVFYNRNGDNSVVYKIAQGLGGTNRLTIVNNSSSINVELRRGGEDGETLGYAPHGMLETELYVLDGNYNIFPVFKRYNEFRDLVETVIPRRPIDNAPWYQSVSFGEGVTRYTINLSGILSQTKFTLGAVWVVVNNQTLGGGIRFMEGDGGNVHTTATGLWNIQQGTPRTFQINMPKIGNVYNDSMIVNNWRFGTPDNNVPLSGDVYPDLQGTFTINQDKMYTVTVTGDTNGVLKAWISDVTDIASLLGGN